MEYQEYVPDKVKDLIDSYLIGEPDRGIPGYISLLSDAEKNLEKITSIIRWRTERGDDDYLPSLRLQRLEAEDHRNMLKRDVECFKRIAADERMLSCYRLLEEDKYAANYPDKFVRAAWATNLDYSMYRERLKQVDNLRADIAKTSEKLASLLRDASTVGYSNWPSELFSIPCLLRQTDNPQNNGHNLHMWRGLRGYVLGDRDAVRGNKGDVSISHSETPAKIVLVPVDSTVPVDPEEEFRNTLQYAWGKAPELHVLLQTVAKAARNFEPTETGIVGAAIEKRQNNFKTDYLRGFGNALINEHGFCLSSMIKKAMAVTATVVLNSPEIDVTYDDIRKLFPA